MRRQTRKQFRRSLGALVLILSVIFCAHTSSAADVPPKPVLAIKDPVFDFGSVSQGTKVSHEFLLQNHGNADLAIQRVVAACGCTATSVSGETLAPGAEGKVRVDLDTSDFSGEKLKLVRVFTNDTDNPSAALTLRGNVEPRVTLNPARVFYGEAVRGSNELAQPRTINVNVKPGSGITISDVRSMSPLVKVQLLDHKAESARFTVSVDANAPLGEFRERVLVNLKDSNGDFSLNLPIFAAIKGKLRLSPGTVSVGVIEGKERIERNVKLENFGTQSVRIVKVLSSDPAVTSLVKVVENGKRYVIQLMVDPTVVTRDLRATLTVTTDSKEEGPLTLNVFGILPPKS